MGDRELHGFPANPRILVVDDEESNLCVLEQFLKRGGYTHIRCLRDPREAVAAFQDFAPDAVLLDIMMPHLDGFQVLEQLKAMTPEGEFLPVLFLTADATTETRHRGLASGAKDYLTKPLDLEEVLLRVRNLLESRCLHLRLRDQNVVLDGLVQERTAQLERARREALVLLARSAEYRDDDTGEHTQRVGESAAAVAQVLGWSPAEADVLRQAAPLHDVGKIGTPDAILLKPGKLTPEEFGTMKEHTLIGGRILSGSDFAVLRMGERIARGHHEKWNGAGYPDGLAGEAIPFEARITAVVDVYDALTHERPYKKAWPEAEATAELRRMAGAHLDARVVEAFEEVRRASDAGEDE